MRWEIYRIAETHASPSVPLAPPPQAYLSEQGYFNAAEGLSGYFGAVTREALQNWQRDQGLRVTGAFTADCKWAYLRQLVRAPAPGVAHRRSHCVVGWCVFCA